jgi:hypothetical protein
LASRIGDRGGGRERRAHQRQLVLWIGNLEVDDDAFEVLILDVSHKGAKIHSSREIEGNSSVTLSIPNRGDYAGDIVWRTRDTFGLEFKSSFNGNLQPI